METIIDLGGDLEQWGPAALHEAALLSRPHLQALKWLLEQGIDVNIPAGFPNVLIACVSRLSEEHGDYYRTSYVEDTIELLVQKGADLKKHGPAALKMATRNGYNDGIRKLLGAADVKD